MLLSPSDDSYNCLKNHPTLQMLGEAAVAREASKICLKSTLYTPFFHALAMDVIV